MTLVRQEAYRFETSNHPARISDKMFFKSFLLLLSVPTTADNLKLCTQWGCEIGFMGNECLLYPRKRSTDDTFMSIRRMNYFYYGCWIKNRQDGDCGINVEKNICQFVPSY